MWPIQLASFPFIVYRTFLFPLTLCPVILYFSHSRFNWFPHSYVAAHFKFFQIYLIYFILSIPRFIHTKFTTLIQKNAQICFSDICIIILHLSFQHVSVRKIPSSGKQTKAKLHKPNPVTFVHSWRGVKDSHGENVDLYL